jgi:hypothetical protein
MKSILNDVMSWRKNKEVKKKDDEKEKARW